MNSFAHKMPDRRPLLSSTIIREKEPSMGLKLGSSRARDNRRPLCRERLQT